MRGHSHDDLDQGATLRPKPDRVETDELDPTRAGRLDALGAAGLLNLQRTVGNARVAAMMEEERSPVLDVVGSGGGQPLDQETRSDMESRFGTNFGDVRVHTGEAARGSAAAVHAQAYTVGSDIVLAGGYEPGSAQGRHLLAHELTHVVQQRSGPVDGTDAGGGVAVSDPGDRFEREASAVADSVLQRATDPGLDVEEEEEDLATTQLQRQEADDELLELEE
jgi:hypothetical protein